MHSETKLLATDQISCTIKPNKWKIEQETHAHPHVSVQASLKTTRSLEEEKVRTVTLTLAKVTSPVAHSRSGRQEAPHATATSHFRTNAF